MAFLEEHSDLTEGNSTSQVVEFPAGQTLRDLRHSRRLTLNSVASRASISDSFLSQIERGKANPSLQVLFRLAEVFGLTPRDLLIGPLDDNPVLITKHERPVINANEGRKQRLVPRRVSTVDVLAWSLEPDATASGQESHEDSDELLLIVSGKVLASVGDQEFTMYVGDCLHYRTSMRNTLRNIGNEPAEVLLITAPLG